MGRPSRLTDERIERICDSIRAGNSQTAAADTSGLGQRTLERYIARGRAAEADAAALVGGLSALRLAVLDRWDDDRVTRWLEVQLPERERVYWRLWRSLTRARAEAEERAVALIREAGLGYDAEEEITETKQVLNKAGEVVTLRATRRVKRFVRDWRAEAWWLEHGRRESWGPQAAPVEVVGVGGGPVLVEGLEAKKARVRELIEDQLAEKRRQRAEAAERAGDRPVYGPPLPDSQAGS